MHPAFLLQILHFVSCHVHILGVCGAYQIDGCLLLTKTSQCLKEMMALTVSSGWE